MVFPAEPHLEHPAPSRGRAAEQRCLALLRRVSSLSSLLQTLTFLLKSGLQSNPLVLTSFAVSLVLSSPAPHLLDTFLFNTLIRSLPPPLALRSFSLLLRRRLLPNRFTFPFLLKACASLPPGPTAQAHASALKFGFAADSFVENTLIHAYSASSSDLASARKVFDRTPQTSPVTWSAMIGACVRGGRSGDALALFRRMQERGVRPDDVAVISVLSACSDLGALELARWLRRYVERSRIPKSPALCNALIDALAKCGDAGAARAVFDEMPRRTVVSYTAVIDGLAMQGRGREAVGVFEGMVRAGVAPDDVAFIGVLTACSHSGLVEEGLRWFGVMRERFGMEPRMEHYGCVVDMLGRAGQVERAERFARAMPVEANAVVWRSLAAACRVHGRPDVGERIGRRLIAEEPARDSHYVMLSNVYAATRRWEEKGRVRRLMGRRGVRKEPGCSAVEIDGEVFEFAAGGGGGSGSEAEAEVYAMVEEMMREARREGYEAVEAEVLADVEEGDGEAGALRWHSEKIAVAFALLRSPRGAAVRVAKNLRVCADCHLAIKLVAKAYAREIVLRDRSRFHCFKDGICSCGDFW
ncbi:pentatricopeptide repeat-containing protein At4g21065-like [Ananas comosus]|uniref:Pentatricopeptide repeat-containing protein At4g21065-like n=1 Tax=Ananas comosus TaxID=4615 RepID=A0A6P5G4M2_ANACO|nr:pentatricopeptide repeat-containing protein At4g21065-like [Ananas comosus]